MAAETPSTALVIAENTEGAYRYVTSDAAEVTIVLAAADGSVVVEGRYDRVVVVGFTQAPGVLRTIVDQAFDIVTAEGRVLVGGPAGRMGSDATPWTTAFSGVLVVAMDHGAFPAVEVAPGSGPGSGPDTGAYLLGALSVLGSTNPRPDLRTNGSDSSDRGATDDTAQPGVTAAASASKDAPAPRSVRDRLVDVASSHRRLLVVAGIVGLLALAVTVGLVALLGQYFLAVLSIGTLMAVVAIAGRQEQRNRQIANQLAKISTVGEDSRRFLSMLRPKVLFDEVRQQRKDTSSILKVVGVSQLALVDVAKVLDRFQKGFQDPAAPGLLREINREARSTFEQVQATINLFSMVDVSASVPPMRGWAVSPDALALLLQELMARRPRLVVECGSGVSTLFLGLAIKKLGLDTTVVALDHDADYADKTNRMLAQHGVDTLAEARHAPLTEVSFGESTELWYDPAAVTDLHDIGLLFVDGPPLVTADFARLPALPVLWDRLAPSASVVMDDMIRHQEQHIVAQWEREHPELVAESFRTEKGTTILRRS